MRRPAKATFAVAAMLCLAALLLAPAAFAQRGTVQVINSGSSVSGLAVNNTNGNLYALTSAGVKVYDSSGAFQFGFGNPGSGSIAIDQSDGDVYVLESGNNRVAKYDAGGNLLLYFGWNVNLTQVGSAPEICPRVGFPGDVCQAGERRTEPGALGSPQFNSCNTAIPAEGIAIAPNGDIDVSEPGKNNRSCSDRETHPLHGNRRLQVFAPSGALKLDFSVPLDPVGCNPFASSENACASNADPGRIGIDSQGTIYSVPRFQESLGCEGFSNYPPCGVRRFSPSGVSLSNFAPSNVFGVPQGVAIDHSNDRVYVYQASTPSAQQYEVAVYDSEGNPLEDVALGLPSPSLFDLEGLAVRDGTSRAYAYDGRPYGGTNRIFVLDNLASVPVATIDPVTTKTSNSATFTGTANPNTTDFNAGYHFEYRAEGDAAWTPVSSSDVAIGSGTSAVPASQDVTGLHPNTTYHVRLVVTRELGAGATSSSEVTFTTDPEAPLVSLVGAARVTDTSARLGAAVDPRHAATSYYFKYGTDASYGSFVPAGQDGAAGQGLGAVPAIQWIYGLTPNTTYHYCIVAENVGGQTSCEDHTFTTTTTTVQDWPARRFELVNEPDKGNQSAYLPAPQDESQRAMTADGNKMIWEVAAGTPDSSGGDVPFFVAHRTASGWVSEPFAPTVDQQPQDGHAGELGYHYINADPSLSTFLISASSGVKVFFGGEPNYLIRATSPADQTLLASTYGYADKFSEVVASDDLSRVVDMTPAGITLYQEGANLSLNVPSCGTTYADTRIVKPVTPTHVFYYSAGDGDCGAPQEVYATDFATNTPTLISGPATGTLQPASLIGVKPDGSEAMFATKSQLVTEDSDSEVDFYLWSRDGSPLQCLTCGISGFAPSENYEVSARASRDFSRVYYDDANGTSVLDVASGETHLVANVALEFRSLTFRGELRRMTPNGNAFAFTSDQRLTADAPGSNQVYLYRDATQSLECVSCRDSGGPTSAVMGSGTPQGNILLADDGNTVAFSSPAALTPQDINGRPDIYEWHNGVVRLVTDGAHEWPTNYFGGAPIPSGISADGRDLALSVGGFRLTGEEHDFYANAYDARVGGGFPVPTPPSHCSEDACQGPLQGAPPLDAQGSSSFDGPGNPPAAKPHKKKHTRRKHHRRRHHKRHRRARQAAHYAKRSHG